MDSIKNKFKKIPLEARASIAYTLCSILQNSLAFITLPLFTRLLTTEEYGQYSIYSSWSAMLGIFLTLNLQLGSFSKAMVKFEKTRNQYIASIQGIALVLSVMFLALYLPFSRYWNKLFDLPTEIMLLMVVEILSSMAIALWSGKKRFELKYKGIVAVTLLTSLLAPLAAYLMVINSQEKGYARIFGYSGVTVVIGLFFFLYNLVKGKDIYQKEYWKYALGFNLPLIIYYISQVIFNQSDRIMINHYCGKGEAAMYSVAYSLALVLTFVLNAINNSYVPWLYQKIKERNIEENKKISIMIAILMAVLLQGVIWIAPEFIEIMAGSSYRAAIWVVPPVATSVLLLLYTQLFVSVLFYFEEKKLLVYGSFFSAALNIVLNIIFIPMFGFVAAGYTTLISYIAFAVCNYFAMLWAIRDEQWIKNAHSISGLLLLFVTFVVLSFVAQLLYDIMLVRYAIILCVFVCILIKHRLVIKVIRNIFNMN